MIEITQELLKEYVTYEPLTGVFTKRKKKHSRDNTVKVGEQLGHLSGDGYIHFAFFGKKRKAHRLAWLYVYGELPNSLIDHIDGDKTNNKINNLRLASFEQNAANRHVVKSKTGYRGVYESKYKGEVVGYIAQYNKKHLGFFKEVKEAAKAVDKYMFEKLGSFVKPNIGGDLDD